MLIAFPSTMCIDFEENGQNAALENTATVASEALNIQPVTNNSLHVEQDKCKGMLVRQAGDMSLFTSPK